MSHPWMPFYVADYLADTGHLSTVEHGAYMLLIMHYWQHGGLPNDSAKLARICRMPLDEWGEINDTMAALFKDGWRHDRIDRELAKADTKHNARVEAGKRGGNAKAKAVADDKQTASNALASSSQPQPHLATQEPRDEFSDIERRCREAAGLENDPSPSLLDPSPIVGLIRKGYDLTADILPKLREAKAKGKRPKTWAYFVPAIEQSKAASDAIKPNERDKPGEPVTWLSMDDPLWKGVAERYREAKGKPPIHYAGRGGMGFHFPTDMVLDIPRELRREPAPLSS